jgi:hypothetical protein
MKDAVSQPIASAVGVAIAFAQHFSRPFAHTFSTTFGAFEIATALYNTTFSLALASTRLPISVAQAQWPEKSHAKQQVAVARQELYAQPFAERWLACAQECKGKERSQMLAAAANQC